MEKIYKTCPGCSGEGSHSGMAPGPGGPVPYDNPCIKCGGDGKQFLCELSSELVDYVANLDNRTKPLMMTYKIFEATVKADYNALTDEQKDRYRRIISLVFVDWTPGTRVRQKLDNMFDGTPTKTAIDALTV